MNYKVWTLDIETYLEIYGLAKKHGKKAGESLQEEFDEVIKKKKGKIKFIGETNKDSDLLTGNLREDGFKILNLNELGRRIE